MVTDKKEYQATFRLKGTANNHKIWCERTYGDKFYIIYDPTGKFNDIIEKGGQKQNGI